MISALGPASLPGEPAERVEANPPALRTRDGRVRHKESATEHNSQPPGFSIYLREPPGRAAACGRGCGPKRGWAAARVPCSTPPARALLSTPPARSRLGPSLRFQSRRRPCAAGEAEALRFVTRRTLRTSARIRQRRMGISAARGALLPPAGGRRARYSRSGGRGAAVAPSGGPARRGRSHTHRWLGPRSYFALGLPLPRPEARCCPRRPPREVFAQRRPRRGGCAQRRASSARAQPHPPVARAALSDFALGLPLPWRGAARYASAAAAGAVEMGT
jgi:hypothetical protein